MTDIKYLSSNSLNALYDLFSFSCSGWVSVDCPALWGRVCRGWGGCRVLPAIRRLHPEARFQHFESQPCHAASRVPRSVFKTPAVTQHIPCTVFYQCLIIVSFFLEPDAHYLRRSTHLHSSHAGPGPGIAWHVVALPNYSSAKLSGLPQGNLCVTVLSTCLSWFRCSSAAFEDSWKGVAINEQTHSCLM